MKLTEVLYCMTHPGKAIEAQIRQLAVGADLAAPPPGVAIEDFANLTTAQAAALIASARYPQGNGVRLQDWSLADQELLRRGEIPKGVPEHPDV